MRVAHRNRVFFVTATRTGIQVVNERVTLNKGHPYLEGMEDRTIFHAGAGRQPSKLAREVLDLAKKANA